MESSWSGMVISLISPMVKSLVSSISSTCTLMYTGNFLAFSRFLKERKFGLNSSLLFEDIGGEFFFLLKSSTLSKSAALWTGTPKGKKMFSWSVSVYIWYLKFSNNSLIPASFSSESIEKVTLNPLLLSSWT